MICAGGHVDGIVRGGVVDGCLDAAITCARTSRIDAEIGCDRRDRKGCCKYNGPWRKTEKGATSTKFVHKNLLCEQIIPAKRFQSTVRGRKIASRKHLRVLVHCARADRSEEH